MEYKQSNMDPTRLDIAYLYTLFGGGGGGYTVGGSITGLQDSGLILQNHGAGDLTVDAGATSFTFQGPFSTGDTYEITVSATPPNYTCTVANGAGQVSGANVTEIQVQCSYPHIIALAAGGSHTCALTNSGAVRCWGDNTNGQLGYGNTTAIGDNEDPAVAGDVDLGGTAVQISAGLNHTCARLSTGDVVCWGDNTNGQLGYGHTNNIGDDELPSAAGVVDMGGSASHLSAGGQNTCVLIDSIGVRCWGRNDMGHLGYNNGGAVIGDTEPPVDAGPVALSGSVSTLSVSMNAHTCALLTSGEIQCWGRNANGEVGIGSITFPDDMIGDDEFPDSQAPLTVGSAVEMISTGGNHSCIVHNGGSVRCWGRSLTGELGYENTTTQNDATAVVDVNTGGTVSKVGAGYYRTCILMDTGTVRCWGSNTNGELGYANTINQGDGPGEMPTADVDVGVTVSDIEMGHDHTCIITETGKVRCWGQNGSGQLGYGHTNNIGDDEHPSSAGDVNVLGP